MDFVTHTLIGVGFARLAAPRKDAVQQLSLAGVFGSTLMDSDSWLALTGPGNYGRYHRVLTHSVWGLALCIVASAALVALLRMPKKWRRFGWFVSPNLPPGADPAPVSFGLLLGVAAFAAAAHWVGDWITGFGNLEPFWPWNTHEYKLSAVTSFEPFLFTITLAWHLVIRHYDWPRRREAWATLIWLLAFVGFVAYRAAFSEPTVW